MKNILLFAVALTSLQAFASKARVSALMGADHVVDTQTIFTNPSHVHALKQHLAFEMGAAGTGTEPYAEGGILRQMESGAKLFVYMGHKNYQLVNDGSDLRVKQSYMTQNNPVEIIYGNGNMAFGGSLSSVDLKKSGTKETSAILKFGMTQDQNSIYAHLTALSEAKKSSGNDKLVITPWLTIGGNHNMDNNRIFGSIEYGNAKNSIGATDTKIKDMDLSLGVENVSLKTKDAEIYFGGKITYGQTDYEGKKYTATSLPVFIGVEAPVFTWMTFRGSFMQNLFFGETKDETGTNTDSEGVSSNNRVAAGLGFNHGNLQLDGTLSAATDGKINGSAFLANAGITYTF